MEHASNSATIEHILDVVEYVAVGIEILAVVIITSGIVAATTSFVSARRGPRIDPQAAKAYRARLGSALLLGLEILVAADIIRTVALDATLESVVVLGILVLIRTFLSWSLVVEIEGRWPWQARPTDREEERGTGDLTYGNARDLGVSQVLGDDERGDGHAGDEVGPKVGSVGVPRPAQDRQKAGDASTPIPPSRFIHIRTDTEDRSRTPTAQPEPRTSNGLPTRPRRERPSGRARRRRYGGPKSSDARAGSSVPGAGAGCPRWGLKSWPVGRWPPRLGAGAPAPRHLPEAAGVGVRPGDGPAREIRRAQGAFPARPFGLLRAREAGGGNGATRGAWACR